MKTKSVIIIFLLLLTIPTFAQNKKEEAANFFQSIVKLYFENDCEKLLDQYADSITIIGPGDAGLISKTELKFSQKKCSKIQNHIKGLESFQSYVANYKIIVLDKKQFTAVDDPAILEKISAENTDNALVYTFVQHFNSHYTDNDYLVFGNIHKSDETKNQSSGLFWFIIRETKNGWKIFAIRN